jgi:hypothetical protein
MSECFCCGRYASERREVETGQSRSSVRKVIYTRLEPVCKECALKVDRKQLIRHIMGFWILNLILIVLILLFKF